MNYYPLAVHPDQTETHFDYCTAARLAKVSERLIHFCERENLIRPRVMLYGKKGVCVEDVTKLKLIRHYHEDLGLELAAVDFILQYRSRIQHMRRRLEEMKTRLHRQAENHQSEILRLRRQVVQVAEKNSE